MKLEVENITKKYKDKTAVDNVSITFTPGVWGLLGANGAGKTTLMRMIAGIMEPTEGKILYDGVPIETLQGEYRRIFGYLPQEFGFYPEFNVQDYLEYMAALKGMPKREAKRKIDELLEQVSLSEVRKKKIVKLSGGMKRKLMVCRALLTEPEILLLDEPTAGMDALARRQMWNLLKKLNQQNLTILLTTHYMEEAIDADRVIVMDDGKVIMDGIPKEIFSRVKELKEHGLDVPQATELAFELKEAGMPLTEGILSRQELVEQLTALLSDEK